MRRPLGLSVVGALLGACLLPSMAHAAQVTAPTGPAGPVSRATEERAPFATEGVAFTVGVIPDTQTEVFSGVTLLENRNRWLLDHRDELDLRFVAQVGDVTNWGWVAPSQLTKASDGFAMFEHAGLPYSLAVGNHDTRAVGWNGHGGYGGGPYQDNPECQQRFSSTECHSRVLLRRTQEINRVFDRSRFGNVEGAYEAGKIDNLYSTFHAGKLDWLVLDLELWPRPGALAWANQVVAEHPTYNVIINTHSYLRRDGAIQPVAPNGSLTPKQVWEQLVSQHPNIVLVVCGHVGRGATRVDRGVEGNKVVSLLTNFGHSTTNVTRLVKIDPTAGTLETRVLAPATDESFPHYTATVKGMSFVG